LQETNTQGPNGTSSKGMLWMTEKNCTDIKIIWSKWTKTLINQIPTNVYKTVIKCFIRLSISCPVTDTHHKFWYQNPIKESIKLLQIILET
jgi:hypothetical protein